LAPKTKRALKEVVLIKYLHRDKEWLRNQYIELDKSYDDISNEFGLGKTTVARWVKRFKLEKTTPPHLRRKRYYERVNVVCEECGKETLQKHAKVKDGYGRFCSQSCAGKHTYHNGLGKILNAGLEDWRKTDEAKEFMRAHGTRTVTLYNRDKRTGIEIKMTDELERREIEYIEQYNLGNKFALDFFLPEYDIVIECDGDYWHRRSDVAKRDKRKNAYIKACGFPLFRFWEHEINEDVEACVDIVMSEINEIDDASA
jgi:very-short-patch-repair endonuclease